MSSPIPSDSDLNSIASAWIARRDHGLSAAENAELAAWLAHPAHAAAFARCEAMWSALPELKRLPPGEIDGLLRHRKKRRAPVIWLGTATAAAAGLALLLALRPPVVPPLVPSAVQTYAAPEDAEARVALPDGSIAVLHRGSRIAFGQAAGRRSARLLSGEAHFTVAKTTTAPFFVHAGQVTIRDIGTAFNVRLDPDRVAVLVTDGRIAVRTQAPDTGSNSSSPGATDPAEAGSRLAHPNPTPTLAQSAELILDVGQEAVVATGRALAISTPAPPEIEAALAWKSRRLSFDRTPLADAVRELNRYNVRQLRIADPDIAAVLLAGGVQSDNLDAFTRLLASGFGVAAETRGQEIVLRRSR